ncbi:MAG: hypothetical protein AAGA99_07785 [Actinomycetota bacterium]
MPAPTARRLPSGRTAELDAARGLLLGSDHARGVQITGPGGIGKTTIARRLVAELHADDRPCAVVERRLNASLVVARVARALPARAAWLRRATDDAERIRRLAAVMCDEPLILVLDGLDRHVASTSGKLRDRGTQELVMRLAQAAEVGAGRILVTTRGPVDDLTGLLPVLPVTPLAGNDLEELLASWPQVRSLLTDLNFATRQVIAGYPRLTELTDAAIRLGRPTRRRLRNELGQEIDLAPTMVRDRLLRIIVDRLDDRAWELLAHAALANRPIMTSTLADALGTTARDHVGEVARQLAAIGMLLATGRDQWLLDSWTASGIRTLESNEMTARTRHLRMAAAYHSADRAGVGLDDAEDAIAHQLAAGVHEQAAERALQLCDLLLVDGQTHRAVALLSDVWDRVPVSAPIRQDVGAVLRRATSRLDVASPLPEVRRRQPTPPGTSEPTDRREPTPAAAPTGTDDRPTTDSTSGDGEQPDVTTAAASRSRDGSAPATPLRIEPAPMPPRAPGRPIDLRVDRAERLLRSAERLADGASTESAAWYEIEAMVERLEQLELDDAQTARLLQLLRALDDVSV